MPSSTFWKNIAQVTASATLGITMLTAVETAPASAAQLQTFKFSGTFGDENFLIPGYTGQVSEDVKGLAGGSFDGTFTVDVDELPTTQDAYQTIFVDWNLNLRNSSGYKAEVFYPVIGAAAPDSILFYPLYEYETSSLELYVNKNFKGTTTGRPVNRGLSSPVYGRFSQTIGRYDFLGEIYVTSFRSEPVPEPFTIAGTAVAATMGLWMKRKQKVSR
ncbi:MAG: PEP-CTERM sorting domain-containing protein [Komarekiella atlantica HA4396-MV6]|jgi:hypothetical protein|nr:PEP-CTERM sorting domain-containing protein [Komarekiella atlantica HA4396-MV6]